MEQATAHEDPTRIHTSHNREWIPFPAPKGEVQIKIIHIDEERGVVVCRYKLAPGTELTRCTHKCHVIAYTISGEWEYEGLKLPEGTLAYEPVDSTLTASSGPGAEVFVVLTSETDQFLIEHLPDGTDVPVDLVTFKQLARGTMPEQVHALGTA